MDILSIFRAFADPTRLRIMLLLGRMELSVGELAQVLGQSQPRVSRHVRILDEAGLAERRKEGSWVFLRRTALAPQAGDALAALIDGDADAGLAEIGEIDARQLAAIRARRESEAADYFASRADDWDAMRSLYVAESDVERALESLLGTGSLGHFLDIGTGTGRMVELFERRIESATAIDKSPEMLRLARAKLHSLGAERLRLVQGDFNALPFDGGRFDTVMLHQVLHYAQDPARVIAEAARVSATDGRIVIVDFAPHEREELRSRDAHARLGFSDAQIADFLGAAGFVLANSAELAGMALTVRIWLGRPADTVSPNTVSEFKRKAAA